MACTALRASHPSDLERFAASEYTNLYCVLAYPLRDLSSLVPLLAPAVRDHGKAARVSSYVPAEDGLVCELVCEVKGGFLSVRYERRGCLHRSFTARPKGALKMCSELYLLLAPLAAAGCQELGIEVNIVEALPPGYLPALKCRRVKWTSPYSGLVRFIPQEWGVETLYVEEKPLKGEWERDVCLRRNCDNEECGLVHPCLPPRLDLGAARHFLPTVVRVVQVNP